MIYNINEGQQADEYKARKAKEAEGKKKADDAQYSTRYRGPVGNKHGFNPNKPNENISNNDSDRYYKTADKVLDGLDKRNRKGATVDAERMSDAINRHIRRHPKQYNEGTIFESVEFI